MNARQMRIMHIRRRQRGVTYVDLLVAALLMSIGMMALVGTWVFSFTVTANTDDIAIAYSLGRYTVEQVKMSGFTGQPEGTATAYFDGNQNAVSSTSSAKRYTVTTSVVSSQVSSGTAGQSGAVWTNSALRTVTVTVTLASSGRALFQTTTYLVRAGI